MVVSFTCCTFAPEMRNGSPYSVVPDKVKKGVRLSAVASNPIDLVSKSTGEVVGATPYVGRRTVRDISDFVKLYDMRVLMKLGMAEIRVLMHMMGKLDFSGMVEFEEEECIEETELSRVSVYKGIRGLVEKDIIKKDKRAHYWVNPNIAYRGSRDDLLGL